MGRAARIASTKIRRSERRARRGHDVRTYVTSRGCHEDFPRTVFAFKIQAEERDSRNSRIFCDHRSLLEALKSKLKMNSLNRTRGIFPLSRQSTLDRTLGPGSQFLSCSFPAQDLSIDEGGAPSKGPRTSALACWGNLLVRRLPQQCPFRRCIDGQATCVADELCWNDGWRMVSPAGGSGPRPNCIWSPSGCIPSTSGRMRPSMARAPNKLSVESASWFLRRMEHTQHLPASASRT